MLGIAVELANAFRQLFRGYGVLIMHPAKGLFIEAQSLFFAVARLHRIWPNGNHGISRGYRNSRRVGRSIHAHIEALPLAWAPRIQVGSWEINETNAFNWRS
jgi:hypothetical protein